MHEQHKGHDAMHAEMMIILIVTVIVAQFVLVEWKKRHYRSFSVSDKNTLLIKVTFFVQGGFQPQRQTDYYFILFTDFSAKNLGFSENRHYREFSLQKCVNFI